MDVVVSRCPDSDRGAHPRGVGGEDALDGGLLIDLMMCEDTLEGDAQTGGGLPLEPVNCRVELEHVVPLPVLERDRHHLVDEPIAAEQERIIAKPAVAT